MWKGFKVIDADAHMQEPYDLWSEFMEPEFYDRRPLVNDYENKQFFHYSPCEIYPEGTGRGGRGGDRGRRPPKVTQRNREKFGDAYEATWSAESRLKDMDRYGWDKQVMIDNFPTPMRLIFEGADQGLLWACARAYNNWAYDFAQADPTKLKVSGVLPNQHDIEGLIIETRRIIEKLGAVTVAVPTPDKGKAWQDPEYDGFWALAEELDFPMSFHGVNSGDPHVGTRYKPRHLVSGQEVALEHALGFSVENMISLGHMIFLGLLEKFPKMRISLLEGNAGWLPFWLGRLDDHCLRNKRQGMWFDSEGLPLKPSEYFKRQGFVACDPDEFGLKGAVMLVGEDNIVWNTDYSHPDAPDPDKAVPDFLEQDIPDSAKRKILWDNAARLYGDRILN
jgi:predicted TIM-barrel fold metal-dependent hydrolase